MKKFVLSCFFLVYVYCIHSNPPLTLDQYQEDMLDKSPLTYKSAPHIETRDLDIIKTKKPKQTEKYVPQLSSKKIYKQPVGALSGVIIYASGGHGWTADNDDTYTADGDWGWYTQRPLTNGMVEDYGNIDQLNFFAEVCHNAGATVVPCRPLGYQDNEIIIDNDDTTKTQSHVEFFGTWYDSASTPAYGDPGDAATYCFAATNSASETAAARYYPIIQQSGYYPVYTWVLFDSNRTNQTYHISFSGQIKEMKIDHRRVGKGWVWLGNYYFDKNDSDNYVEISNYAPGEPAGVVVADAIRFGNGMGNIDRGAGVSGQPKNLENAKYWAQNMNGINGDTGIYDPPSSRDYDDNTGTPPRLAGYMNNDETGANFAKAVYIGFHSNAGGARGCMGLYNVDDAAAPTGQLTYATIMGNEIANDMEAVDSGIAFPYDWVQTSSLIYHASFAYGEIRKDYVNNEMCTTIAEVAYHDNANDAAIMLDARGRKVLAKAVSHAIIKFLNNIGGGAVPLAFSPDPPINVGVVNNGDSSITVFWDKPADDPAGAEKPTGYMVYMSTNGYGYGAPAEFVGENSLSARLYGLPNGKVFYFRVASKNAGGESLPSEAVAVRVDNYKKNPILIVNAFDRMDKDLNPKTTAAQNLGSTNAGGGTFGLVRPLRSNSYDYCVKYARALDADKKYGFDTCSNEAVSLGKVSLLNYAAVIWYCGEDSVTDKTITSAEQALLEAYFTNGGNLFLSGADIAYDLDYSNNGKQFYQTYFRTLYASNASGSYVVNGAGGTIFEGLGQISFLPADGAAYDAESADRITPTFVATGNLSYIGGSGGFAGIQINGGSYKAVSLAFPFEAIASESLQANMMQRIMSFFLISENSNYWMIF